MFRHKKLVSYLKSILSSGRFRKLLITLIMKLIEILILFMKD